MAWLDTNPPVRSQWFASRNRPLTGCTVLHTSESILDTIGPDTGAEAVAEFIRTRTTAGSYHDLVDSDTAINLVDYQRGAFHDGTGSNNWALSLSFACRTSDWRAMSADKRRAFLRQGAVAFARQQAYRRRVGAPLTELRLISKAQSDAGQSGFTYHGLRDPGRRTDPGVAAPNLFPFDEFIAQCRAVLAGDPEDDMPLTDADLNAIRDRIWHAPIAPDGKIVKGDPWAATRLAGSDNAANLALGEARAMRTTVDALVKLVAQQNGLTLDDVRRVVAEEIARGVDVDVTVQSGDTPPAA